MLKISDLEVKYGDIQALWGVNLEVERGKIIGLLGPNGAGKTTMIKILTGLADPSSGEAKVMGYDVITDYQKARAMIGLEIGRASCRERV